jgi:hypothetical protein
MDTNQEINRLRLELESLKQEFFRANFSTRQDFQKYSDFKSRLKVPVFSALPSTCEVGEVGSYSGKLYVCSAANTWTIVGTQS